jgi:hypothetical protein
MPFYPSNTRTKDAEQRIAEISARSPLKPHSSCCTRRSRRTPAMAANVSSRLWSFEELIDQTCA